MLGNAPFPTLRRYVETVRSERSGTVQQRSIVLGKELTTCGKELTTLLGARAAVVHGRDFTT
jgi:hypothetical protein